MPQHASACRTISATAAVLLASAGAALAQTVAASDLYAPHVSTLAANTGQQVALHLRRKVAAQPNALNAADRVVLFVHGATMPGMAFALEYKDYDWMAFLARAGFDVWSLDMSGYGSSPRPMMDDPCNVDPEQQKPLLKRPLRRCASPHYPIKFKTITDDWAEIDFGGRFHPRDDERAKVSIVGWSAGGPRVGGYVAQHPDKVNRIVLYAPGGPRPGFKPPERPDAGFPVALQTRAGLEQKRWDPDVRCSGQVEPGVRDALWTQIMQWDHRRELGAGRRRDARAHDDERLVHRASQFAEDAGDGDRRRVRYAGRPAQGLRCRGQQRQGVRQGRLRLPLHAVGEAAQDAAQGLARMAA